MGPGMERRACHSPYLDLTKAELGRKRLLVTPTAAVPVRATTRSVARGPSLTMQHLPSVTHQPPMLP